jgi:hypothetical protein
MPGLRAAAAAMIVMGVVAGAGAEPAIPAAPAAADGDDPTASGGWPERLRAARQRHADWLACIAANRPECSPRPAPAPDPMQPLLDDDTLVKGDIVSTPQGLKVFRGGAGAPHSPSDFVAPD